MKRIISTMTNNPNSHSEPKAGTSAVNECDTNADTCCLGKNFVVLEYTQRVADVYAYIKDLAPILGVPIVSGATAWDDPTTEQTYILVINEGLYYGNKMDHSLINPNQIRDYGIPLWDNAYDKFRNGELSIQLDDVKVQMRTQGTKILFESRAPTREELQECPMIQLTGKKEWNPKQVEMEMSEVMVSTRENHIDEDLLESIDPSLSGLKEKLVALVPKYVAEVTRYMGEVARYDDTLEDIPTRQTYTSTERHIKMSAEVLADRFGIGLERARQTLRATTQRGTRSALLPISRRYRADRQFGVKRLDGKFATDTIWAKNKTLRGNVASQIYSHKCGFNTAYHLVSASGDNIGYSLSNFVSDYGAPKHLTYDGASSQTGRNTHFQDTIRKNDIKYHVSGPRRPNENPAEGNIREIKKKWYRIQSKTNAPDRLWDYGISYVCETGNLTVNSSRYSNGRTPIECITGDTPDVSEYIDFGFYDWVTYRQNAGLGKIEIGRWMGVSHRVGKLMSYWILPESGIVMSCTTVQRMTHLEKQIDEYKERMNEFQKALEGKWQAESANILGKLTKDIPASLILSLENEDEEFLEEFNRVIKDADLAEGDDDQPSEYGVEDTYLGMEMGIRRDEEGLHHARVKRRAMDENGKPIGRPNHNPLLDSRQYEVEYSDGIIEVLAANIIAENLLAQVDDQGHRHLMIDEIEDHRKGTDAVSKEQGTITTPSGLQRKKKTTKGWEFYVRWKGGSGDWVTLKDLKESYPVPLADYAVANDIQAEPAFAWWVPYTVKKRKAIIGKMKSSKHWERTHKYGVRVPRNMKEALQIDAENGNTMWVDAVKLEMKNNRVAFEEYDGRIEDLVAYEQISGHLIFDVKLSENFRRKARFVADGHLVETPASVTYSTVVSRDSVRILLLAAALNGLEVKGADVQNAFLSAKNLEKHWMRAGPEFGPEQGKVFIVVRALYGLKSASAAFRAFMAKKLDEIGFQSSPADPDVWMRPAIKPNGDEYYEYILMYVDDILAISMDPTSILMSMEGDTVKYKNGKIEPPEMYLGAKLKEKEINGRLCWTISSVDYIKAAVQTVKDSVNQPGCQWKLPSKATTPMVSSFIPELDGTPELGTDDHRFFQEMIGMLRWATELGRVDILHEVSLLSQYQASPRQGHMEQALHIFAYLDKHPKLTLYMDPGLPNLNSGIFSTTNASEFKEYYREAKQEMPHRMPRPRGVAVCTSAYVDSSHGSNKVTRRSHSGHILFVNSAPVKWISRRQQTVETSAFSSEFIALKQCIEDIEHLRFKLRMFGIPIYKDKDGDATSILCDNEGVVTNTSNVESSLNKKHSSIAYHFSRWNVAAGVCKIAWVSTNENLADAMTKRLCVTTRDYLFGRWTY